MATTTATPEVLWAQRSSNVDASKNFIYLTINVPDVPKDDIKLNLTSTGLSFEGRSGTQKRMFSLDLEFYAEIDVDASKISHTARDIEMKLCKKELSEAYWPRLLKDSKKLHWLKTDFDKWVDEDEQNEAPEEDFSNFGGMGGGGMGGLPGGMGGGDFGGIDFSKLGGGAGMPMGNDLDDESDDEMPPLEGEEDNEKAEKAEDAADAKEVVTSS